MNGTETGAGAQTGSGLRAGSGLGTGTGTGYTVFLGVGHVTVSLVLLLSLREAMGEVLGWLSAPGDWLWGPGGVTLHGLPQAGMTLAASALLVAVWLLVLALAIAALLLAYRLHRGTHHRFCESVAWLICFLPLLGTLFGVLTLLYLKRPAIRAQFRDHAPPEIGPEPPPPQIDAEARHAAWFVGFAVPPGHFLVNATDMDVGSIVGGRPDPSPQIVESLDAAMALVAAVDDLDFRVDVYDDQGAPVYRRREVL